MGLEPGGSERASPRASPAHSARSAPAGTVVGPSVAGGAEGEPGRRGTGAVTVCRGPGLHRELGRNVQTGRTLLSALRRPRLSRPRARARHLEKQRSQRTFLRSQGRTTPVLQSVHTVAPRGAMEPGLPEV